MMLPAMPGDACPYPPSSMTTEDAAITDVAECLHQGVMLKLSRLREELRLHKVKTDQYEPTKRTERSEREEDGRD